MTFKHDWVAVSALVAAIALPLAAHGQKKHDRYILVDMGTLGGPESSLSGPCCQMVQSTTRIPSRGMVIRSISSVRGGTIY